MRVKCGVCLRVCACLCFTIFFMLASQVTLVKNLLASAGDARDVGSIPRSGKSPTGGNGYPLQYSCLENPMGRVVAQTVKHLSTMWETQVRSLGWEDLLEKEMAHHSSTLAWKIPWTEEPGGLQPMGSQRVEHDWATSLTLTHSLRGASQATIHGIAKNQTWLSMHTHPFMLE